MKTPASILGHPIHPMLVAFPIGLWVFSVVCDIVSRGGQEASWSAAALYTVGGGIIGALLAAVPGLADLLSLPESRARKIGFAHMAINLLAALVFAIDFFLRVGSARQFWAPFGLSLVGLALISLGGWLGGSLVYVHGVAVMMPGDLNRPEPADTR